MEEMKGHCYVYMQRIIVLQVVFSEKEISMLLWMEETVERITACFCMDILIKF